jgi:hypothetical protein
VHRFCHVLLAALPVVAASSCDAAQMPAPRAPVTSPAAPAVPATQPRDRADDEIQIVIYAMSKGQGVPEATRAVRDKARTELQRLRAERRVLDINETRIGIEGERRICATFATREDAEATVAKLRSMSEGVELFNIAVEPCPRDAAPLPKGVDP